MDKLKAKIRKRHSSATPPTVNKLILRKRPTELDLSSDRDFARFCSSHEDSKVVRVNLPIITLNTTGKPYTVPSSFEMRKGIIRVRRDIGAGFSGADSSTNIINPALVKPVMNQAGYLYKRGENAGADYHKKYFRLSEKGLSYNKNEVEKQSPTVLQLHYMRCELSPEVQDSTSTSTARYYFKIKPDSLFERTYFLAAESDYERRKWMVSIRECNRVHFKSPFKQTSSETIQYLGGGGEDTEQAEEIDAELEYNDEEVYEPIETCPRNMPHSGLMPAGPGIDDELYLDHTELYTTGDRAPPRPERSDPSMHDYEVAGDKRRSKPRVIENKNSAGSEDAYLVSSVLNPLGNVQDDDDNYLAIGELNPETPGLEPSKDFDPCFVLGPRPAVPPPPRSPSASRLVFEDPEDDGLYADGFSYTPNNDEELYADGDMLGSGKMECTSRSSSYLPSSPLIPPPPNTYPKPPPISTCPTVDSAPPPFKMRDSSGQMNRTICGEADTIEYDDEMYADSDIILPMRSAVDVITSPPPAIPSRAPIIEVVFDDDELYADGESISVPERVQVGQTFSIPPVLPPKTKPPTTPPCSESNRSSSGKKNKSEKSIKKKTQTKLDISPPQFLSGPKFDQLSLAEKHSSSAKPVEVLVEPPPESPPMARRKTFPRRPAPSPTFERN